MDKAGEYLLNLDLNRYYRIYSTIHEMLNDRNFTPVVPMMTKNEWISQYIGLLSDLQNPDEEFEAFDLIDSLSLFFTSNVNKHNKLIVYFHPFDSKLAQKDINFIHHKMSEENIKHLIIVANNKATPKVSNVLKLLGHGAQIFSEEELMFNMTKCQLVPKHTKVDNGEKERLLNTYAKMPDGKLHPEIFPAIFITDPVVKYYNFKIDDIIKIERPRKDGYYDITYRIVTSPLSEE